MTRLSLTVQRLHDAVERSPSDPEAWAALGAKLAEYTDREPENHAAASAALLHALALAPADGAACMRIGRGLRRLGLAAEATQAFERALDLDDSLLEARESIAELMMEIAPESAVEVLEEAVDGGTATWRTHYLSARAHFSLGDLVAAKQCAELATRQPDAELHAFWLLAQLLGELDQRDECIAAWEQVVKLAPGDPQAATALGSALVAGGKSLKGILVLERVAQQHPDSPEAWLNLGMAQKQVGRCAAAADSAATAIGLAPNNAQAHFLLAQSAERAGDLARAAGAYEQATKNRPNWAEAYQGLGRVQSRLGHRDRARWALLRATELAPDNKSLRAELQQLMRNSKPPTGLSTGAIEGQLSEFSVSDAMELLRNMRLSGRLEIHSGIASGSITLAHGMICGATSPRSRSVVQALLHEKLITQAQISELMRKTSATSAEEIAEQIAKHGLVPERVLAKVRATQVRAAMAEMLDWSRGKFAFHKGNDETASGEIVIDPAALILDLMRVRDENREGVGA